MAVTNYGSSDCAYDSFYKENICDLIQTNLYSSEPQWPGSGVQGGDSGGPVFCYACYSNSTAKPTGLVEGTDGSMYAYATFIGSDLGVNGGGAHIYQAP